MIKKIILLIGLITLTSCDCFQQISGIVVDKETGKTLKGVTIYCKKMEKTTITDTTGNFSLSKLTSGFCCPRKMTVIANLKNYNEVKIKIRLHEKKIIVLKKEEQKK